VRANVVYRSFCRIGMEKVPDAKTLVRLGQVIGAETIAELHDRIVAIAQWILSMTEGFTAIVDFIAEGCHLLFGTHDPIT